LYDNGIALSLFLSPAKEKERQKKNQTVKKGETLYFIPMVFDKRK